MKRKEEVIIFILGIMLISVITLGIIKDKKESDKLTQLKAKTAAAVKVSSFNSDASLYDKISKGQEISVLVLGDNIGESLGVENENKWYNSFTKWLSSEYGVKGKIKLLTSPLGTVFSGWADYNLEANQKYDLVFVCFGENDLQNMSIAQYSSVYEALIRKIKESNSKCEVVNIIESSIRLDKTFPESIIKISNYYDLQYLDEREVFNKSGANYSTLSSNGILPNKQGYDLYASSISDMIKSNIKNKRVISYKTKALINSGAKEFEKYTLINKEQQKEGFEKNGDVISASKKGSSISYNIDASMVGISFNAGVDFGKLTITIDDSISKGVDCHSEVSGKKQLIIYSDIKQGKHQIKIQAAEDKKISLYGIITN